MNSLASKITTTLLPILRQEYADNYSDIMSVKAYWHNLMFLTISKVNCLSLSEKKHCNLWDLVSLGILPPSVAQFETDHAAIIGSRIEELACGIYQSKLSLPVLREYMLGMELYVSQTDVRIEEGKVSRDTTGSYYTPYEFAKTIVEKTLSTDQAQALITNNKQDLRIADLSCGGGEFFWATQEYLYQNMSIPYEKSALFFWGLDVDPIALQITICRLLKSANVSDWKEIVSHFLLGNPLIATESEGDLDQKNELFALNRIYAPQMGINYSLHRNMQFDIILGNPPWEKTRFEERKFFLRYYPEISIMSKKDDRERAIANLNCGWHELFCWVNAISDDYKTMCSKYYRHPFVRKAISGELNTYVLFTELAYELLSSHGLCSLIVKSTLATAPAHKCLWSYFLNNNALLSTYFFENKNKIFNIDSRERFAVVMLSKEKQQSFVFSAGLTKPEAILDCTEIDVTEEDVRTINPFTNMLPNVSSTDDLKVLVDIHRTFPLFQEVYPDCHFGRLIHLTAHAKQIDTVPSANNVPIYEGKFIEQYDGRYSTFGGMSDEKKYAAKATAVRNAEVDGEKPLPESRYFVQQALWNKYASQYSKAYSLCWRSLTSPTNARTTIAMVLPTCPTCQSIQMLQVENNKDLLMLLALFNSLPFDYFVRMKMPGIDLAQSVIRQIPVPSKESYEQKFLFNEQMRSLKTHILSCVYHLLKYEPRLASLLGEIEDDIYVLDNILPEDVVRKQLDHLFAQAYQFDELTFGKIRKTFPKY